MFTDLMDQLYFGELNPCRDCTPRKRTIRRPGADLRPHQKRPGVPLWVRTGREIDARD